MATFATPISEFGGYFANNSRFPDAVVDFYDRAGALIGPNATMEATTHQSARDRQCRVGTRPLGADRQLEPGETRHAELDVVDCGRLLDWLLAITRSIRRGQGADAINRVGT